MNVFKAVTLKLISALLFALMSSLVRFLGEDVPLGQTVFFRAAFAIIPVMILLMVRRELGSALYTARPLGHLGRGSISVCGMFLNFAALQRLPLSDATAISFASPLITVALAAMFLGEHVRIYRWSAVAVGFIGIIVMLWPYLDIGHFTAGTASAAIGAVCAVASAFTNAGSVVQTRRLTTTETTSSIVFYFSIICALGGLATLPFGWVMPSALQLAALISIGLLGGMAHVVLTESYHHAPASLVAPLDYTTMIWAFILGYWMFGEIPSAYVYVGAAIVAGSGIFVIWRERQLGLRRMREVEDKPAQT
jgi:drug/metabolite transporter (DMT)-like permease